jgi:hypothetical protein
MFCGSAPGRAVEIPHWKAIIRFEDSADYENHHQLFEMCAQSICNLHEQAIRLYLTQNSQSAN